MDKYKIVQKNSMHFIAVVIIAQMLTGVHELKKKKISYGFDSTGRK